MRQILVGIFASAALLTTAGCSKNEPNNAAENVTANLSAAAQDYFKILALPVKSTSAKALQGEFMIVPASATDGIPSVRVAGGCLIFNPADIGLSELAGRSCNTNAQCQGGGASAGYCDGQTHSCWARPAWDPAGAQLCNKGKVFAANVHNLAPAMPLDVSANIKPGTRVRVDACLNKTFTSSPPCKEIDSPDRIEVMGPVAKVQ
jgi:hypothetical protein